MKTIQIEANQYRVGGDLNNEILRAGGVKRIHNGWYTVKFFGMYVDPYNVVSVRRNRKGEFNAVAACRNRRGEIKG